MNLVFLIAWIVSIAFSGVIALAAVTYIRRTLQLIKADSHGSAQERLLDGIDNLELRLDSISERLIRMDERLHRLEGGLPEAERPRRAPAPGARAGLGPGED